MNLITLSFVLVLLLPIMAFAQGDADIAEYGNPAELKGVTKIFIATGSDMYSRNQMITEIEGTQKKGAMSSLKIVARLEDAEIVLAFTEKGESYVAGATRNAAATSIAYGYLRAGVGLVLKPLPNDGEVRLLMRFDGQKRSGVVPGSLFGTLIVSAIDHHKKGPGTNFARAFIKAYMKANGENMSQFPVSPVEKGPQAITSRTESQEPNRQSAKLPTEPQNLFRASKPSADDYNEEGMKLYSLNKFGQAEHAFREAVKFDANNALYHHNLGTAINAQLRYEEAEREIDLAVRLAPNVEAYSRSLEIVRSNRRH